MHEKIINGELPEDIKQIIWTALAIFIALAVFIIFLTYLFTQRKNKLVKDKILMKANFDQELLQTQIEIQEQTLKTISEEIHDNIGQVLSLAKLNLNTVGKISDHHLQLKIDNTKELVSKAINDLRDLSRSLHGDKMTDTGLEEAISNELKILQNTGQYDTHLNISGKTYALGAQKEMVLYRIVQEALHNSVKHAKAKNFNVQMDFQPGVFSLSIKDDGKGFNPDELDASKTGIGLKNMQSRANLIGGKLTLNSKPGKGTAISIIIPSTKPLK